MMFFHSVANHYLGLCSVANHYLGLCLKLPCLRGCISHLLLLDITAQIVKFSFWARSWLICIKSMPYGLTTPTLTLMGEYYFFFTLLIWNPRHFCCWTVLWFIFSKKPNTITAVSVICMPTLLVLIVTFCFA